MSVAGDHREGIAEALSALTSDFIAYTHPPDSPVTPCVFPYEYEVDYTAESVTLDGAAPYEWTVLILVSRSDETSGHTLLDDLVDAAIAAIKADDTLGGRVADAMVTKVETDGTREFAGIEYLAIEMTVVCR